MDPKYLATLKRYQELLCNFSKRNRELHYKENSTSLSLTKLSLPSDFIERKQVLDSFVGARFENLEFIKSVNDGKLNLHNFFKLSLGENRIVSRKVNSIRLMDDSFQKEFGISGAWFLGPFLVWRIKDMKTANDIMVTPIFKNAIDIKKNKYKQDELIFEKQVLEVNPSLKILLKRELGISLNDEYEGTLEEVIETITKQMNEAKITVSYLQQYDDLIRIAPTVITTEDEDGNKVRTRIDLNEYLNEVEKEVYKITSPSHFYIHDVFYVDFVNASKISLYNDYEEIYKEDSPNLKDLILGVPNFEVLSGEESLQDQESKNYFVVDIDSSQHIAIKKVSHSNALVIQGPPGTGKSQTITNMISQLMADGKKVLFVAEKRAALDVVYSRLKKSNLDSQSVIIHSSILDRSALYKSFVESLKEKPCEKSDSRWLQISSELEIKKKYLTGYYKSLKNVSSSSGLSNSEVFSLNSKFSSIDLFPPVYKGFGSLSYQRLENSKADIFELEKQFSCFENYFESPWKNKKSEFFLTENVKYEFIENKKKFDGLYSSLKKTIQELIELFPGGDTESFYYIPDRLLADADFHVVSSFLNEFREQANSSLVIKGVCDRLDKLKSNFIGFSKVKASSSVELVENLIEYYRQPRGFFSIFTVKFWKMRSSLKEVFVSVVPNKPLEDLLQWLNYKKFETEISQIVGELNSLISLPYSMDKFESTFEISKSNLSLAYEILKNGESIGGSRFSITFNSNSVKTIVKDVNKGLELKDRVNTIQSDLVLTSSYFEDIAQTKLSEDIDLSFNIINNLEESLSDVLLVHQLRDKFQNLTAVLKMDDLESVVKSSLRYKKDWFSVILSQCSKRWHDEVIQSDFSFQHFDSLSYESKIKEVANLFDAHQIIARDSLNSILASIKKSSQLSPSSIKLIEHEANKQRRVKSPRELMESGALESMLAIKRCWLMSPLSISQILPNIKGLFDVVIFDEASQVRIEDALPSIFRAKSLIVVGDNKQMPPTDFFGSSSEDEDEDEVELGESVLDQALKSYEDVMLEWHYRSKSEALIAFSNYAFYDRKLIAVPNPGTLVSTKSIEFHTVSDGCFTSKHGNPIEAKRIVSEISSILKSNMKASIGVISMGMSQQKAIQNEIDALTELDPEFAEAYNFSIQYEEDGAFSGFFNRNLENVQGDERETIFISIGYAKPNENGKLRKFFGPLSKSGGGRRLNVAATRAKSKMKVFCSFNVSELGIDDKSYDQNKDSTIFARFLHYCKAISDGDELSALSILNMFTNAKTGSSDLQIAFNQDLKEELEKRGYKVAANVGSCGFYLDLAIVSPSDPNTYILGIECDGALYQTNEYSRDRDKARQKLLEMRGWQLHRIWSQDWSRNREGEITKILKKLENVLSDQISA